MFGNEYKGGGLRSKEQDNDFENLENRIGSEKSTEDGWKPEKVGTSDAFIKNCMNVSAITLAFPLRY